MNPDNPRVKAYDEISEIFGSGYLLLTVEGTDKNRMASAAAELAAEIRERPEVSSSLRSADLKLDRDFLSRWDLMLQNPSDLKKLREMFSRTNLVPFVKALNDNLVQTYTGDEADEDLETGKRENDAVFVMSQIENFSEMLTNFISAPDPSSAEKTARSLADTIVFEDLYTYSPDGTMLIFAVNTTVNLSKDL